ncbi:Myosin type-2 heavy chain 1, partial [Podila verticillata]
VRLWKEKYELSQQSKSKEIARAAENPTVPKAEFETLKSENAELQSKYNESIERVRTLDLEIAKTKDEIHKLAAQAKVKPEDSETVLALKRENQYVKEQLAQLSKATGRDTSSFPVTSRAMSPPSSNSSTLAPAHTVPSIHNSSIVDKYENSYSFTKEIPHNKTVTALPPSVPIPHHSNHKASMVATPKIGRNRSNSTPDIASLENGVLFRPQKTTNSVFDNLDNHSRTTKTMSSDDWSRRTARIRPSIHSLIEQPEVEIMRILEDEEGLQEEIMNGLIKNMKIPSPSLSNLPLIKEIMFPAHLIGLLTTQMWKYGYIKESERLMINVMQAIQHQSMAIVGDDTIIPCAYWLSNVHELLSLICISEQDITREEFISRGNDNLWYEYEQLVSTVKYELECLEYNIFHVWMKSLKKQLNKMIIPAIIESQALPGFITNDSGRFFNKLIGSGPTFSMDDLLLLFNKIWKAMSCYYVEHSVVRQVMTELLKMVGVTGFNDLLMRRNFCTWKRAMQIQYNITRIEEWCKGHDLPEGTLQLEHLMQATKLLQLKKASHNDIEIIYDVCWMLTPTQVQKLVQNYMIADYEVPVSPDLIKAIAQRVAANEKNDTLMLDAISLEDAGSFETPEIRDVDLEGERYLPGWLVNLSRLKSLMHLVVAENTEQRQVAADALAAFAKSEGLVKSVAIIESLSPLLDNKKSVPHREGGLLALGSLATVFGQAAEPFLIPQMPKVFELYSDKMVVVRQAAEVPSKAIMALPTRYAVRLLLPVVFHAIKESKWQSKIGAMDILSGLTFSAPQQISAALSDIIPIISETMWDSKPEVRDQATKTITDCFN